MEVTKIIQDHRSIGSLSRITDSNDPKPRTRSATKSSQFQVTSATKASELAQRKGIQNGGSESVKKDGQTMHTRNKDYLNECNTNLNTSIAASYAETAAQHEQHYCNSTDKSAKMNSVSETDCESSCLPSDKDILGPNSNNTEQKVLAENEKSVAETVRDTSESQTSSTNSGHDDKWTSQDPVTSTVAVSSCSPGVTAAHSDPSPLTATESSSCTALPKSSLTASSSSNKPATAKPSTLKSGSSKISNEASPSLPSSKLARGAKVKAKADKTPRVTGGATPVKSKKPGRRKKKQAEPVQTNRITDFFPVRRSGRQTKSEIEKEKQHQLEQMILSGCENGLEITEFENKGRGIVATKEFSKGDFVVEYAGQLIDIPAAEEREKRYASDPNVGCYMYYFKCGAKQFCVDATEESGRLGRLINHSREGNCCTKALMIHDKPHLILVANRDIKVGEELNYDYGDRSKAALEAHPWLKS